MPTTPRRPPGGLRVARIRGVDLVADWSLLLIFALIVVNLGAGAFPAWHPEWTALTSWSTAVVAGVLFLVSIALHELSHALVARRNDIPVHRITLFLFGGMAHMEKEPPSPRSELLMAGVGPLVSLGLGALATLAGAALVSATSLTSDPGAAIAAAGPVATLLLWLGPVNLLLGLFNLLPGFPLDGGRVLRAVLWWSTGDLDRATRIAGGLGQGLAWALIGAGVSMAFGAELPVFGTGAVQGLWLVLIGWFLNNAARASVQQIAVRRAFDHVRVADVMRSDLRAVDPDLPVQTLVDRYFLHDEQTAFPVVEGGRLVGLVDLDAVRSSDRERWGSLRTRDVMVPLSMLTSIAPGADAAEAFGVLGQRDVVPVVEESGEVRGLVSREDLGKWLALRGGAA